jgi:endoglycosylceramidase
MDSAVTMRRTTMALLMTVWALLAIGCGDGDSSTLAVATVPTVTATPIVSVHPQFVTDAQGRALILHGLNVSGSAKDDPLRMPWISQADAERVRRDWGFNVARLLIFWDAIEPVPGQYDEGYLDRIAERIQWFANAGVYVILDMHQDVYGHLDTDGEALGFDGAPAWAARTDGLPHRIASPWALTYLQPGVKRAFDNFWNDMGPNSDLQEHYAAMWAHVAERFRSRPWVLGYNLMNEPFAGSAAAGNLGGIPFGDAARSRQFQETLFRRFHERTIAAIRGVDPDGWIFYEPLAFPANNGGPSYLGPLHDPRPGENRLVYFPHLYAVIPELRLRYDPADTPELDSWIRERSDDLAALQEPMMIGEFGLPWDAGGDPLGYLQKILDTADETTSGWAYWSYDPGNWAPVAGADLHETPNANVLVRAYPQRIAGRPIRYGYDPHTRVLDLTFVDQPGVIGPTEIYLPARRVFPAGWRLEVSDPVGSWTSMWDAADEVLSVNTAQTGAVHTIRVVPSG